MTQLAEVASKFEANGVDLSIVANEQYTERLQSLIDEARKTTATTGDDAFRLLQILTTVKGTLVV